LHWKHVLVNIIPFNVDKRRSKKAGRQRQQGRDGEETDCWGKEEGEVMGRAYEKEREERYTNRWGKRMHDRVD
jgi:hypothetical protein